MERVSIIALFPMFEASIAADRLESGLKKATPGAAVAITRIPVIALLTCADDRVTAAWDDTGFESAHIGTPISRLCVSIFTFLLKREEYAVAAAVEEEGK